MSNIRRIPSYIVPIKAIDLGDLVIKPGTPVTVHDDWNRQHWCGSLIIEEHGHNGLIDKWIYLHSLLADSRLPIYAFQAFGHEDSDFNTVDFDPTVYPKVKPREINFDPDDVLPAIYLEFEADPVLSYGDIYRTYASIDAKYHASLKNYLLSQDINFNKRLRSIDPSYWQIVMLISAMEALLPMPEYCKGKCANCGKGLNHPLNEVGRDWKNILFGRIKDKKVRQQYRLILDVARWEIRNHAIHNGLMPTVIPGRESLADGVTEYTTKKAIEEYTKDHYSLETLVEQLRQVCRYVLLNQLIKKDVFPPLKGIEVHSKTIHNFTAPGVTLNLDSK